MSSDIYVLKTDPVAVEEFLLKYPAAIVLPSNQLDDKALHIIASRCFTKFFYVVDPVADIVNFDFTYRPGEYDEAYVHVWQQSHWVRLFTMKNVYHKYDLYSDTALWRGLIPLKHHDEEIFVSVPNEGRIRNEPDIYLLSPTTGLGTAFINKYNLPGKRCTIITTTDGMTRENIEKILFMDVGSYFFYVVDVKTLIKEDFDFTFVPDHWDMGYVHIWNMCTGVRLYNRAKIELSIDGYTDKAWDDGLVEIKNIEEDIFEIQPDEVFRLNLVDTDNTCMAVDQHIGVTASDIEAALSFSSKPYVYFVKDGTETIDEFDFTFLPEHVWEDDQIHIWNNKSNIMFVSRDILLTNPEWVSGCDVEHMVSHDEVNIYTRYGPDHPVIIDDENFEQNLPEHGNGYFFIIDKDVELVEDFNLSFVPEIWDEDKMHTWQRINPHTGFVYDYSGLQLMRFGRVRETQYVREPGCVSKPFDVFMLSYKEDFADEAFAALQKIVPHAKRIHGVKGIFQAHMKAAAASTSPMFYVVDADAVIEKGFDFSFMPAKADYHKVYTWRSRNPINGLLYGFGGVKLFPKQVLLEAHEYKIDFTTSITEDFVPMAQVSNVTRIDYDPFTAWKSAFRECVKLSSKVIDGGYDPETDERLRVWQTEGKGKNSEYAQAGADWGSRYGLRYADNLEMLANINDYEWLEEIFKDDEQFIRTD